MEEQYKSKATPDHIRTYDGAVAIVTGAASGIGRALAEALAQQGARAVVLVDRQKDLAEEVATGLRSKGTEAKVYEVDVREFSDVKTVVTETKATYGRLDFIFNNAGVTIIGTLEETEVEDFNYVLDVNIRGVTNGVQAAYPVMKEQGFGHIVNTSSLAGLIPGGDAFVVYGTSKHAVVGLSLNLRIAAARHGVHVSVICPGYVDTDILKGGGKYGIDKGSIPQDLLDELFEKYHPMDPNFYASKVLKLVAKNKAIIIGPGNRYKMLWFVYRLFPSLGLYLARKNNDKAMKMLKAAKEK